jgi:hypothetical protein
MCVLLGNPSIPSGLPCFSKVKERSVTNDINCDIRLQLLHEKHFFVTLAQVNEKKFESFR